MRQRTAAGAAGGPAGPKARLQSAVERERSGRDGVPDSDDCGSELDTDRDGIPNGNDEDDEGDGVLTRDVFSVAILGALENPWGIRGSGSECARD